MRAGNRSGSAAAGVSQATWRSPSRPATAQHARRAGLNHRPAARPGRAGRARARPGPVMLRRRRGYAGGGVTAGARPGPRGRRAPAAHRPRRGPVTAVGPSPGPSRPINGIMDRDGGGVFRRRVRPRTASPARGFSAFPQGEIRPERPRADGTLPAAMYHPRDPKRDFWGGRSGHGVSHRWVTGW